MGAIDKIYHSIVKRVNKKSISSLYLPSKPTFSHSKLRSLELHKPQTTSFYSPS